MQNKLHIAAAPRTK